MNKSLSRRTTKRLIKRLQKRAIYNGVDELVLQHFNYVCNYSSSSQHKSSKRSLILAVVFVFISLVTSSSLVNSFLSARCLISSNYLVWEATRPLADCSYCANVTKPIVLRNISRRDFAVVFFSTSFGLVINKEPQLSIFCHSAPLSTPRDGIPPGIFPDFGKIPIETTQWVFIQQYAYLSKPIIVKDAISHWRATKAFNFDMFKRLYEQTDGSYESLDDGCQFLNFKTDLFSLKEVLNMPEERARNEPGQRPWYVGWGNCHPEILTKVRKYYSIPKFLPEDAEFSATENIFFGYEMGAVMHLDYIPRLMWQGQVKGNKTWIVAPVPECDHVCYKFEYYVEPGDIVFLDTRVWYHATKIPKGQFSLTVQSEYG